MSIVFTLAPYHVLGFSLLYGTTTFHSYISSPIAFKVLPRKEFGVLQKHIFPGYFLAQSVGPILIGLTAPYTLATAGIASLVVSSLGGLVNYAYLLPKTQGIKEQRLALNEDEAAEPSAEMKKLTSQFGKFHGLSLLFNLVSFLGLTVYGFQLTKGLLKTIPK
ncbi:unnamed protein product [Kuraishia capsulata CBS 1993]|uniref:TMEM205-like domain-containing protein n=1 Tax=Kuraishia capsulata CBS 1993 TaxID=1382522 RepID=W6MF20_9ASCO|nr:uncharacterized protein KUCA_T00000084001 [Kuraishia capsulata CBS 1993]CDK24124.1 unnamed protein product [Kuraishia capsulata CBS 1993]